MAHLHAPERHEPLIASAWEEGRVRDAVARIAAQALEALGAAASADIGGTAPEPGLYEGAAGVAWGLQRLGWRPAPDLAARRAVSAAASPGFLMGRAGLLLQLYDAAAGPDIADALHAAVLANIDSPALELMWGQPGTMLAALAMHHRTGDPRWAQAYRRCAEVLDRRAVWDPELGAFAWTQTLYGEASQFLGLVHGFAGIGFALVAGRALLAPDDWRRWSSRLADTLRATAVREGPLVNWAVRAGPNPAGRVMPVQVCHGAPGMVLGLARLDQPIERELVAAGRLIWTAGPLAKGYGLCHGTAGNGYALLKLHERTGEEVWLDRARLFAMHALLQYEQSAAGAMTHQGLWTGPIGLAVYLADCLAGTSAFPTLEDLHPLRS